MRGLIVGRAVKMRDEPPSLEDLGLILRKGADHCMVATLALQLDTVDGKLDRIIELLEGISAAAPVGLASKPVPPPLRTLKEGRAPKRGEW